MGDKGKWEEGQGFAFNVHWQNNVSRLCVFLAVMMHLSKARVKFSERTNRQMACTEVTRPEAIIKSMMFPPA